MNPMFIAKSLCAVLLLSNSIVAAAQDDDYLEEFLPNSGSLTVEALSSHYGSRLIEGKYLCSLPPTAALRQPNNLDCRSWRVDRIRALASMVRMDSAIYRALPDGTVIERSYMSKGDCNKLLGDFFAIKGLVFEGVTAEASGAALSTTDFVGTISATKQFSKQRERATLSLQYEKAWCQLAFSVERQS